jgi:hypothetical protein
MFDVENDHETLNFAADAYEKALKQIEITVQAETWMNLAMTREYLGDNASAMKTCASMVKRFPKYDKIDDVSMRSAILHMHSKKFARACAYVHSASRNVKGCCYYSQMDLIFIMGRINELWHEELINAEEEDENSAAAVKRRRRAAAIHPHEEVDEEDTRSDPDEKWDASDKAYKTVFRHYLSFNNTFGMRVFDEWIVHAGTWVKTALRAVKSGHFILAEDLFMQALIRNGWWRINIQDIDDEEDALPPDMDLLSSATRLLYEIAKCRWYQGDAEGAKHFLVRAEDCQNQHAANMLHPEHRLAVAKASWHHAEPFERLVKMPFPKLVQMIPVSRSRSNKPSN